MKIRVTFGGQSMTATLLDNATVHDFLSLLPAELPLEDYGRQEKIAYLPRPLTLKGSARFGDEAPGDICYWAPWRTLSLFHAPYRYSDGLVRLGRWDGDFSALKTRGTFPARLEAILPSPS